MHSLVCAWACVHMCACMCGVSVPELIWGKMWGSPDSLKCCFKNKAPGKTTQKEQGSKKAESWCINKQLVEAEHLNSHPDSTFLVHWSLEKSPYVWDSFSSSVKIEILIFISPLCEESMR